MLGSLSRRLDAAIAALPRAYPGPGGAVTVLRQGETLVRHAWGWANAERRIPFTPRTLFRMCSVTKQFTCAALLDAVPDLRALDGALRDRLPQLEGAAPGILHLCHNQSGLRDYWAVAMLHGSPTEAHFGPDETQAVISGTRTLHFAPGTRYSYANQNFRLLSDLLEEHEGEAFADILRRRIFARVGMDTAFLAADTRAMPDGTEGYEGSQTLGFRAAENRIVWTGDAGLGASLDDMIAWERHIDAMRDDTTSLPGALAAPVAFANGAPASYGFGLSRSTEFDRAILGHGGALRGWRSHRLYVPAERVSVVVMFNHLSDAHAGALDLLAAILDATPAAPIDDQPAPAWLGTWREPETGLSVRIDGAGPGRVRLRYGHVAERLDIRPDGSASNGRTLLRSDAGGLRMERPQENQASTLVPWAGEARPDIAGRYRCAELGAELEIAAAGGSIYGAFQGMLGRGRMEFLEPIGQDLWALPCPRALDHTPPGDWTLAFRRTTDGRVADVEVGCWLARRLTYAKVGA
jgi:D-aminopeptidase